jgi:hypothetical protein
MVKVGHQTRNIFETAATFALLMALTSCSSSKKESGAVASALLNDFRQEISAPPLPARMTPGQNFLLNGVVVKNTGQQTWQARGNNQVELTYDWMTPEGKLAQHGVVTILPADLGPGQTQPLVATIVAPEKPGHYVIRFTMIAEKIAWFSNMGGPFVEYPVAVVPQ